MENSTNTVQHDGQTLHIGSEAVFVSRIPNCNLHPDRPAVYDAKTRRGPWGFLCEECFDEHDCHIGLGRGQYLILRATAPELRPPKPKGRNVRWLDGQWVELPEK